LFFIWKTNFFKRTQKYRLLSTSEIFIFSAWFKLVMQKFKPLITKNSLFQHKKQIMSMYRIFLKNSWNSNFQLLNTLPKTKLLQKRTKVVPWHLMRLLRFKQKIKNNLIKKKNQKKWQNKNTIEYLSKKNKLLDNQYKLGFNLLYKNHLALWTGLRVTYLLQNLIQKYFGLHLTIKLSWPLVQFKNLKFYRLLFPNYKSNQSENNSQKSLTDLKLSEKKYFKRNRYVYAGQMTNHLLLQKPLTQLHEKAFVFTKLYANSKKFKRQTIKPVFYRIDLKKSKVKKI